MRGLTLATMLLLASCQYSGAVGTTTEAGADNSTVDLAADLADSSVDSPSLLEVVATITAIPRRPAAEDPTDFDTEISLRIKAGGAAVEAAQATVTSSETSLTLEPDDDPGSYVATHDSYDQRYTLELSADGITPIKVSLDGPAIHIISQPKDDSTLEQGESLTVRWAPSGAMTATITTLNLPTTNIDDNGTYLIDSALFFVTPPEVEAEDFIRLERTNSRAIAETTISSQLTISVQNEVEFDVTP